MRWRLILLLAAVALLGASAPSMGQIRLGDQLGGPSRSPLAGLEGDSQFNDPVTLSAQFTAANADRPAVLMITADVEPGWHVYSITQPPGGPTKTKIELSPSPEYHLAGQFRSQPEPTTRVDNEAWVGLTIEEHADQVTWYAPIELAAGVDPASLTIAGQVRMLACKESCIPVNKDFTAQLGRGVPIGELASASGGATNSTATSTSTSTNFQPEGSEVKISGRLIPGNTVPGDGARLEITLTPAPNWHIYAYADRDDHPGSKPTLIAIEQLSGLKAARPATTAAVTTDDSIPEFGTMRYHQGPVTWEIPIDVPPDTKLGEYPITGVIGYQACETRDDGLGSCELPKAVKFATTLTVGNVPGSVVHAVSFTPATYKEAAAVAASWSAAWSGNSPVAAATSPATASSPQSTQYDLNRIDVKQQDGSILYYIVLAFVGGIILNLMPCVLPVIGLKVMSFVQQAGHSRTHALVLNVWYAAGIVSVFLLLGFLAAWIGLSWGGQFGSTAFNVTLAAIVFAMALSLLGVWEIPIPGFFGSGAAHDLSAREGPFGAFVKGAITTVLATPCTGPFMASAIAWAVTQSMATTLIVFGALGLGMASPYLLIGVFPELLRFLPKPGAWMETFKQLMGFVLMATVVFILSFVEPAAVVPTLLLLVGIGAACWLAARTPLTAELGDRLQSWALAGAVVLLAAAASFGWLYPDVMQPRYSATVAAAGDGPWKPFSLEALQEQSVDRGRTVLVDFSAAWCLTCKALEKTVLHTEAVERAIAESGAVTMYADYTDYPPEIERTIHALKSNGVPVIAIFPGDRPYEPIVFRDGYTSSGLIAALEQATGRKLSTGGDAVALAAPPLN
ncbi:MAG: cytochrome c biogenesis protein CcdA [Pirellulales bacterium]